MTAELYDLGMRLRAAARNEPSPRLTMAPVMPAALPIAVRAVQRKGHVTAAAALPGQAEQQASGPAVLAMLDQMGVRISSPRWHTLVTEDRATLPALLTAARSAGPGSVHADTAAHIGWWADRADFPGSSAVVPLVRACRERWVTGADPAAEASPRIWRAWLRVPGGGCAGMLALHRHVQSGDPLPLLSYIEQDTSESWKQAQAAFTTGADWRQRDTPARAAAGLWARNDAADLFAAALLRDPLFRRRAVHTGHVVTGTASRPDPKAKDITVTCTRGVGRMRENDKVTGWAGSLDARPGKVFAGTVAVAEITGTTLTLTVTCRGQGLPPDGSTVTLHAADPVPKAMKNFRNLHDRLYRSAPTWLATGRRPGLTRRDVPLGVMIAAARDEPSR